MHRKLPLIITLSLLVAAPAFAQLNLTFDNLFDAFLEEGFQLSPGPHGQHFIPAAREASGVLAPTLNSLIAGNVSSFPLSSTITGVSFDFSTGRPVTISGSQGPIFAETAQTLGLKKLTIGFNATHLDLNNFRGLSLNDMRFTFLHQDVTNDGSLGESPNESDIVDIFLNLDADANIFALYATYGVTRNLDISIAIPFVDISLRGDARAVVQSFTLVRLGRANHHFGSESGNPELIKDIPYDESAASIGDIAIRFKYRFPLQATYGAGALIDVRVPTGDEVNFLGTGSVSVRTLLLASKQIGDFTPHLNVGYEYRGADLDSDEVEITVGFDQKVVEGVTFALDFLGEFDVRSGEAIELLSGTERITDTITVKDETTGEESTTRNERIIERSNIPQREYDHTLNAAAGFRVATSERIQLLGNLIIPLNNDGLRSSVAFTAGFSVNL